MKTVISYERLLGKFYSFHSGRFTFWHNCITEHYSVIKKTKNKATSQPVLSTLDPFRGLFVLFFKPLSVPAEWSSFKFKSPGQDVLSVLLLVFLALAHGALRSISGEGCSVAAGLQMVKQLVSCGELVIASDTTEVHFLLEVEMEISDESDDCFLTMRQGEACLATVLT